MNSEYSYEDMIELRSMIYTYAIRIFWSVIG